MPIQYGKDTEGCFLRWGDAGAKYHYTCGDETSRKAAKKKVIEQAVAIGETSKLSKFDKFEIIEDYLAMLKWLSLPSSNLYAIDYVEKEQTLKVEFQSGSVYYYFDVPKEVYEKLQTNFPYKSQEYIKSDGKQGSAFSLGSWFYYNVRDKYRYKQIS